MHDFRRLEVWGEAIGLAEAVYELTTSFPRSETYGLVGQLRRAVVSVSSNIAEGSARDSPKDFARFLRSSMGSLSELESQLEVSSRLGYIDGTNRVLADVGRLRARIRTLHDRVLSR